MDKVLDFRGKTPLKMGMEWGGTVPSLSALNVKMGFIDLTIDPHFGSEELYRMWMTGGDLEKNDIVFTMEAPLGNVAFISDDKKYILSQRVVGFKINRQVLSPFVYQLMLDNRFQKRIDQLATGTTAKGINQRSLRMVRVRIPSLKEQQKIAAFLTAADEWIENLKAQKGKWEEYKKGMMQKIFSRELRFKDEDGNDFPDWEEKRLGEVVDKESSNTSANSLNDNTGRFKIYGAEGVYKRVDFFDHEIRYIAIVKDGAGVGRLLLCEAKSSVTGTLDVLKAKKGFDIDFLFYHFKTVPFRRFIVGTTIPHIYFRDYKKHKIEVPSLTEQQKIAGFLTTVDEVIHSHQQRIVQAEEWKKGLMQRMFV